VFTNTLLTSCCRRHESRTTAASFALLVLTPGPGCPKSNTGLWPRWKTNFACVAWRRLTFIKSRVMTRCNEMFSNYSVKQIAS